MVYIYGDSTVKAGLHITYGLTKNFYKCNLGPGETAGRHNHQVDGLTFALLGRLKSKIGLSVGQVADKMYLSQ